MSIIAVPYWHHKAQVSKISNVLAVIIVCFVCIYVFFLLVATNNYGGNIITNPNSVNYTALGENWVVGSNHSHYSVPYALPNHFPGNSGTLSSSASILSNGMSTSNNNHNGSRLFSTSHLVHIGNGNPMNSSNKALPSPSHRISHPNYHSRVLVSPSHQSQPDLRLNSHHTSNHFMSNNNSAINSTTIPEESFPKDESNNVCMISRFQRFTAQYNTFC